MVSHVYWNRIADRLTYTFRSGFDGLENSDDAVLCMEDEMALSIVQYLVLLAYIPLCILRNSVGSR